MSHFQIASTGSDTQLTILYVNKSVGGPMDSTQAPGTQCVCLGQDTT